MKVWGARTKGLVVTVGDLDDTTLDVPSRISIA